MTRKEKSGIVYYCSELLTTENIENYFLTRKGGVSKGRFAELNLSFLVGDNEEAVKKNLSLVKEVFDIEKIVALRQEHSTKIIDLDHLPLVPDYQGISGDGIITCQRNVGIGVLSADCFPLLIAEPWAGVIACIHCGRRGVLQGIVEKAIKAMEGKGAEKDRMLIAIGSGICYQHYEIDDDIVWELKNRYSSLKEEVLTFSKGKWFLDLKKLIIKILGNKGISPEQIDASDICTFESEEFYSYRRKRFTGRHLSFLVQR